MSYRSSRSHDHLHQDFGCEFSKTLEGHFYFKFVKEDRLHEAGASFVHSDALDLYPSLLSCRSHALACSGGRSCCIMAPETQDAP
jgi:hypothetical protein